MAAPAHPRGLGLPRPARDDHGPEIYVALPRKTVQLRVSGVSESRRSSWTLETTEAGGNWCSANGRIHDGSRSECQRTRFPSSGLHLLFRGGCRRKLSSDYKRRKAGEQLPALSRIRAGQVDAAHHLSAREFLDAILSSQISRQYG